MKTCPKVFSSIALVCCAALTVVHSAPQSAAPSRPATTNSTAMTNVPRSVFVIPRSPQEGRDPFYPDSNRPYGSNAAPVEKKSSSGSLVFALNGLSGAEPNRLAIINGKTLAEGEEADIATPTGRVRVRCVQIKESSVIIEVDGQRRELHLRPGN